MQKHFLIFWKCYTDFAVIKINKEKFYGFFFIYETQKKDKHFLFFISGAIKGKRELEINMKWLEDYLSNKNVEKVNEEIEKIRNIITECEMKAK